MTENPHEKHILKYFLQFFTNIFTLPIGKGSPFDIKSVLIVLIWTAMANKFLQNTSQILRRVWNLSIPSADVVRRLLRRKPKDELKKELMLVNRKMLSKLKRMRITTHPVICAIDTNDKEYYGRHRESKLIVGGKEKNGTSYFYRMATLCVVERGIRFEIAMREYTALDSMQKIVGELLDEAQKYIRIRLLLADRGINSVPIRNLLDSRGIKYLMPVESNDRIEREVNATRGLRYRIIPSWRVKDKYKEINYTTLLIINKEEVKPSETREIKEGTVKQIFWLYTTNLPINYDNIVNTVKEYERRWGIETAYRVNEHEFFGKTTSHHDCIRLFYLYLSIILKNLWLLYNLLCNMKVHPDNPTEMKKYIFTAEELKEMFRMAVRLQDKSPVGMSQIIY